jgi:hypothetical protein
MSSGRWRPVPETTALIVDSCVCSLTTTTLAFPRRRVCRGRDTTSVRPLTDALCPSGSSSNDQDPTDVPRCRRTVDSCLGSRHRLAVVLMHAEAGNSSVLAATASCWRATIAFWCRICADRPLGQTSRRLLSPDAGRPRGRVPRCRRGRQMHPHRQRLWRHHRDVPGRARMRARRRPLTRLPGLCSSQRTCAENCTDLAVPCQPTPS